LAAAYRKLRIISASLVASGTILLAGPNPSLDAAAIIQRSLSVNTADWNAQPRYSFHERDVKGKVLSNGVVKDRQSKTYEIVMIDGSPYERLIEVNNEPISRDQQGQEQIKYQREVRSRRNESSGDRHTRIANYRNQRAEEHLLMEQMVAAFNFKLIREEQIDGIDCYLLEATPKPGYHPPVEKARVLIGMRGHLWIDKAEYHWAKVEAQVVNLVSVGFFVAQIKPGTRFELEQAAVGNVWLPKRFAESVNASVFGIYGVRTRSEEWYSDYKLTTVSAKGRAPASEAVLASDSNPGDSRAR
jgi:hypothetical protein